MEYDLSEMPVREMYALLTSVVVPRPIAWVSTVGEGDVVNVAPFSYFNLLGTDPPVVAIGVGSKRDGSPKDTAANITRTGVFVVNLVDETLAEAMNITAIEFPHGTSELIEAGLTATPSRQVMAPRVAEAKVHLECQLAETVILGNNTIFLGEVVFIHVRDGESPETFRFIGRLHGGGWYTRTNDRFEMPRLKL